MKRVILNHSLFFPFYTLQKRTIFYGLKKDVVMNFDVSQRLA
jgi:hypothetical protein